MFLCKNQMHFMVSSSTDNVQQTMMPLYSTIFANISDINIKLRAEDKVMDLPWMHIYLQSWLRLVQTGISVNNINGIVWIFTKCIFGREMHHMWCDYSYIRSMEYIRKLQYSQTPNSDSLCKVIIFWIIYPRSSYVQFVLWHSRLALVCLS